MIFNEARRSKRYIALLPVSIEAVDLDGNHKAGPWSGRIIDISKHGASLFLTRVMDGQYHICFSVQENSDHLIKIEVFQSAPGDIADSHDNSVTSMKPVTDGDNKPIILKARPVWMDSYDYNDLVAFKMGVEFLEKPSRSEMSALKEAMKRQMSSFG